MKEGKNLKIWSARSDLVGDCLCALPVLNWLELQYPNSYKFWSILRKCQQCAPLFFNHRLIDKIVISDFDEGFGPTDKFYFDQCDIKINTRPKHLTESWHSKTNMYEETFVMAGIPLEEYYKLHKDQQLPRLEKWFNINKLKKTISMHCFPGYGRDNMRSFGKEYSENLITELLLSGYRVIRLGHPNEPSFSPLIDAQNYSSEKYQDLRHLSFIEQIQITLGTSLFLGNDSGFSLAIAAYHEIPQVNLVCQWNVGHTENPLCLAPKNDKCINLWDKEKCSNIPQEKVLQAIKDLI